MHKLYQISYTRQELQQTSTGCVFGKWVCLVTLMMSLFDLQDVCIVIGSLATLDFSMVVDLIGIYVLKGPYCTLTTTNWFLQALSMIPRGSWGDVARRFTMIRWATSKLAAAPPSPQHLTTAVLAPSRRAMPPAAASRDRTCSDHLVEEIPFVSNSGIRAHQVHNPTGKPNLKFCKVPDKLADFRIRPVLSPPKRPNEQYSPLCRDISRFLAQFLRLGLQIAFLPFMERFENSITFCMELQFSSVNCSLVEVKKEHKTNQIALEASHKTIAGLTEIGLRMSKKIERMKAKKQQTGESHMECHHKLQARIQEAEDTIQEQHLIIEALVEDKASLLQTIQDLQEYNGAPAPFDD
ncbi:hypothetical protein F511_18824 [Dorcoceras hygrometricum]|uniref:Uncharacterized protein n=1 Tax=Dorcoceras hygrometricum TaxID=472368 RepID=A0A2Z7BF05_9LAMI|nr:hypothetical protein F511_18824 [Dorcoceras hygrometricum]